MGRPRHRRPVGRVEAVIADQVDLPARLTAAGLVAEAPETLLVADISRLDLTTGAPGGVELVRVADPAGAAAMVQVHDQVFGGDHAAIGRTVLARLAQDPPTVAAVLALAGKVPGVVRAAGIRTRHRLRQHLGRRHRADVASTGHLPGTGRLPGPTRRRSRLSVPAGRRNPRQPTDPATPGLHRARHHHTVHPSMTTPTINRPTGLNGAASGGRRYNGCGQRC